MPDIALQREAGQALEIHAQCLLCFSHSFASAATDIT